MNEIKFRAWDKEKGVMLTDTGLVDTSFVFGNTVYGANDNSGFSRSYSYYGQAEDKPEEWGRPDDLVWMQYTGLKDKNGAEMYEGDIVNITQYFGGHPYGETKHIIKRSKYTNNLVADSESGDWRTPEVSMTFRSSDDYEVIGNVYEDKELEVLEE